MAGTDPQEDFEWPGLAHPGLASQQFVVTDNPVIGVLFGPDGEVIAEYHERDDRFGFAKWVEDR